MSTGAFSTRGRTALGVAIGLAAAVVVLPFLDGGSRAPAPNGPVLSDCDGTIRELVIHYVPEAAGVVVPTYRDFLGRLPARVTVDVVCPDRAAFDELAARVGPLKCALRPVVVDHPITCWSRDRWLALAPARAGDATVLLSPRREQAAKIWPARLGDEQVGADLAKALGRHARAVRSGLLFDGGDFVADRHTVFVTPAVLLRNLQHTVRTREELIESLSAQLGRKVVLLHDAPDHHAGMFMMPVGRGTILVGDPAAARELFSHDVTEQDIDRLCPPEGADFSEATRAKFDAVARQCERAGYRVVRVPIVPGRDHRTFVTYLNVILDAQAGGPVVYMPVFQGAEPLNRAAAEVWASLGYEVRPVDCTACYPHFGSLRCLVNVVRRDALK